LRDRSDLFLLVVVPCLNEEKTVGSVVRRVPSSIPGIARIEVLVMDDGSTDSTVRKARDAGAQVVSHPVNLGLGRTFREAVGIAVDRGADIMVNIDGDGQFNSEDIPLVVGPVVRDSVDMATASRFADRALVPRMPAVKRFGNWAVALIVWLLTGTRYADVSCGFRAFSRRALLRMNLFGSFTYTQETFLDLAFKKLRILEIPIKVRGTREFGTSRMASSIPRYAVRSLQIMLRAFISYRPFTFFGAISAVFSAIGAALLGFLGYHYLRTGEFSPHIWAGFVGGSFAFLGVSTLMLGFIGDMLVRVRLNQEKILFHLRGGERQGTDAGGRRSNLLAEECSRGEGHLNC
jgi:glycosyltransferase involved in cell wall biosynthesis